MTRSLANNTSSLEAAKGSMCHEVSAAPNVKFCAGTQTDISPIVPSRRQKHLPSFYNQKLKSKTSFHVTLFHVTMTLYATASSTRSNQYLQCTLADVIKFVDRAIAFVGHICFLVPLFRECVLKRRVLETSPW